MTSPDTLRNELALYEERPLSPEDYAARVAAPWTPQECEDFDELVAWFLRRYPTPAERLASARQLMEAWMTSQRLTPR